MRRPADKKFNISVVRPGWVEIVRRVLDVYILHSLSILPAHFTAQVSGTKPKPLENIFIVGYSDDNSDDTGHGLVVL